jgi:hypothetical protein
MVQSMMAAAQRLGVQLPAPGYSINKSVLVFKMRMILESAASRAGQLQRRVGRGLAVCLQLGSGKCFQDSL